MNDEVRIPLIKPLKRALRRGHPWVFRDAIKRVEVTPGTVVALVDEHDKFVARGWADEGPIAVRVLTVRDEPVDRDLLWRRIEEADRVRRQICPPQTTTFRLIHGEGDRLPGVVCDVYGQFATLALDGSASVANASLLIELLVPVLQSRGVEGLMLRSGRRGRRSVEVAWGREPPPLVEVEEQGLRLVVDLVNGQKTGLFLDHRPARRLVRRMAKGLRVLDLYSYVGGFSASAGLGGAATVVTVDVAPGAIDFAAKTWAANRLDPNRHRPVVADVPTFLASQADAGNRFDFIIADPPSFAPNEASRHAAQRGYAKLHRACLEVLSPGGYLLAASCSSHIDRRDFEDALVEAADKARRNLQILDRFGAPGDHPRLLGFPEGDYLKVIVARSLD